MTMGFRPAERTQIKLKPDSLHCLRPLLQKQKGGKGSRQSVVIDDNGCWLWQGTKTNNGYGTREKRVIHRQAYEEVFGAVDRSLDIDHLCRVHACCNPLHLEAVTRAENLRRGIGFGETHHCSKLTDDERKIIVRRYREGNITYAQLGAEYGVTAAAVCDLVLRGRHG